MFSYRTVMFSRFKYNVVIGRYHHWINHANIKYQLHVLKDYIKKYNHDNHQKYFSSSTIDNDNIPIETKDDGINDNVYDDKNVHCDVFDSHQGNDKNDHNNDDDDDYDYDTRQYIDIIPTESHSLTIDDMISYNFHTIINDEKNINNYDNNTIADSSSNKRVSGNNYHINDNDDNNNDDISELTSNNITIDDISHSNTNTTNNNSIKNNNNNVIINDNYSTIDLNSIEDSVGVFRESEIDDIRVLVNNYTAPALAEALRDRETTLQSAAMLFFNNDMISLKHLLSPFCKVW